MRHALSVGLILAVLLAVPRAPASSVAAAQKTRRSKPRVAVLEFKYEAAGRPSGNKADNQWWVRGGSKAMQDVFVTELRQRGFIYGVSKDQMCDAVRRANSLASGGDCEALLRTNNLDLSGNVRDIAPGTWIRVGKLLGVNYLLTGSVTEYGVTDKGAQGAGRKFVAAVSAGLIDTSTGEIAWADEARREVSVGGFGGGVDDARMFDRAMKPCIRQLTKSLNGVTLPDKADVSGKSPRQ